MTDPLTDDPHPLTAAFEAGESPLGTWLSIGHPAIAEITASLGLDFVLIDTEHTSMSLETVEDMTRGVEAADGDTQTIVRVPWNDPVRLKRVVDIGVDGIMVPMVDTPADARSLVDSITYPPEGSRGIAGSRATGYGRNFEEYVNNADGSIFTIAQIESEAGLANATDVAAVDGIDALFVGPADLSGALGIFGDRDAERYRDAVQQVLDAGADADVPVGTIEVDPQSVADRVDRGFDFLIAGKDAAQITASTQDVIDRYEAAHARQSE